MVIMFGLGFVVSVVTGGVPTWQNHGPGAGLGLVYRTADPKLYFWLTTVYGVVGFSALIAAFFRITAISITHIRLLFFLAFLCLLAQLIYIQTMAHQKAESEEFIDAELRQLGMPVE